MALTVMRGIVPLGVAVGLIGWVVMSGSLHSDGYEDSGSVFGELPAGPTYSVKRVSDGDTLVLENGKRGLKVRLCGIDAPEKEQPLGKKSGQFLWKLVMGKSLRVDVVERDPSDLGEANRGGSGAGEAILRSLAKPIAAGGVGASGMGGAVGVAMIAEGVGGGGDRRFIPDSQGPYPSL